MRGKIKSGGSKKNFNQLAAAESPPLYGGPARAYAWSVWKTIQRCSSQAGLGRSDAPDDFLFQFKLAGSQHSLKTLCAEESRPVFIKLLVNLVNISRNRLLQQLGIRNERPLKPLKLEEWFSKQRA